MLWKKNILILISLIAFGLSCNPAEKPENTVNAPIKDSHDPRPVTMEREVLYDKILGLLVGSAIGDAMGAPTEMWNRYDMQVEYGHITDLDSMVREPSAEGIWDYNLPAGSTTDDTRWKALMVDYFTGKGENPSKRKARLYARDFARLIVENYEGELDKLKKLDHFELDPYEAQMRKAAWLKEWAMVGKPFVEEDIQGYADGVNKFYGGEMVCAGMLFCPVVGAVYPGDPEWAYQQTYEIDIFDHGYAKDISGLTAAMVSAAMVENPAIDSVLGVNRSVDPREYFKSRLVGRTAFRVFRDARYIVHEVRKVDVKEVMKDPPVQLALPLKTHEDSVKYAQMSTAYQMLDQKLERYPFHPSEIHIINLTALMFSNFDFELSMEFVTNYGRDNDTVAAVTGSILGAYWGAGKLPPKMVKQVIDANLKLGFDFEEMARRMTDSLLG